MKFKTLFFSLFSTVALISCDTDSLELNNGIFDDQNFIFASENFSLDVESHEISSIQSDNLGVAPLGVYHNADLQRVETHYVTQLLLPSPRPTFIPKDQTDPEVIAPLEKVVLYVPYFGRNTQTADDPSYVLDSVYTHSSVEANRKLDLKIYKNNFLLRDFNPSNSSGQTYFSSQYNDINNALGSNLPLNTHPDNPSTVNTEFEFSNSQIQWEIPKANADDEEKFEKLSPGLKVELKGAALADFRLILNEFVKEQLSPSTSAVFNQNIFNNYFRGLFFKVTQHNDQTQALGMLRFNEGFIRMYYKETNEQDVKTIRNIDLKLGGRSISLQNNISLTPTNYDSNKHFILRGGQGTKTEVNIPNDVLTNLKNKVNLSSNSWLINDATITFFVNEELVNSDVKSTFRILLYDLNNGRMLSDFNLDAIANSATPEKDRRILYGGRLIKIDNKKAYRIRIVEHLKNMIKNNNVDNVKLGLVVVSNVTDITFRDTNLILPVINSSPINVKIPTSSTVHPFSTVLYKNHVDNGDKNLELKITYTTKK